MPSEPAGLALDQYVDAAVRVARGARERYQAWRRSRLGWRGGLLYVLPAPLMLAAVAWLAQGELWAATASGMALGLVWTGAHLNRLGILDQLVAHDRRYTRAPRLPHQYLGVAAVAAGTALAAQGAAGHGLAVSTVFGLLAATGFHLVYRLPPLRLRAALPRPIVGDKALRKTLREAERRILAIDKAALRLGNQELEQRLTRIAGQGRAILDLIAARPQDRFRARKFLNVYLEGAERVASHYARTHRLARPPVLEQNFRTVLAEVEAVLERQLAQLAEQDVFDLDVQIEVLRQQLKREGIS